MEKGKKSKKHEPLGKSSKRVEYQVENMKSMQMIWAARRLIQIEQYSRSRGSKKRVEAVDINGSILSCYFARYHASSTKKW